MHFCTESVHTPHSPPNVFFGEEVAGTQLTPHLDMLWELDLQVGWPSVCIACLAYDLACLQVGFLMNQLEQRHLIDNTIVIFMSDNGTPLHV